MMMSIQPTRVLVFVSDIPSMIDGWGRHSHNRIIATAMIIINTWWYPIIGMKPVKED
jgi:hypothetical protein